MVYLRYLALVSGFLLVVWQGYTFFSLDEEKIRASLGDARPTKFIQVGEEELQALNKRLAGMKAYPKEILQQPAPKDFGRKREVFLPD